MQIAREPARDDAHRERMCHLVLVVPAHDDALHVASSVEFQNRDGRLFRIGVDEPVGRDAVPFVCCTLEIEIDERRARRADLDGQQWWDGTRWAPPQPPQPIYDPANHESGYTGFSNGEILLHLGLSVFTLGLWVPFWIRLARRRRER